jgi:hypothetical protein
MPCASCESDEMGCEGRASARPRGTWSIGSSVPFSQGLSRLGGDSRRFPIKLRSELSVKTPYWSVTTRGYDKLEPGVPSAVRRRTRQRRIRGRRRGDRGRTRVAVALLWTAAVDRGT